MNIEAQAAQWKLYAMLDTGAQASMMQEKLYNEYFRSKYPLQPTDLIFTGFNGKKTSPKGVATIPVTSGDLTRMLHVYILCDPHCTFLLVEDALSSYGTILNYETRNVQVSGCPIPTYAASDGNESLRRNGAPSDRGEGTYGRGECMPKRMN